MKLQIPGAAFLIATLAVASAAAQEFPARPLKIVQGFAAGGNADTASRILANEMTKTLGQPIVVETKPGAGSTIAADAVAKAPPDGHTLLLVTGGHAVAGALYKSLPYQTVDSFDMVSTATFFPFLVMVRSDLLEQSLRELLDRARAKPGSVAYGSAGIGSTQHLTGELLGGMSGAQFLHVPYKGDTAAIVALLGGETQFIIAPATAALGQLRAGKLRALAATGSIRWQGMPEVPTVAEAGVPGFDVRSWMGVATTRGTPRAAVERLNAAMLRALQVAEVRAKFEEMGGDVRGSTPEEMRARVASELQNWTKVISEAKIERQ